MNDKKEFKTAQVETFIIKKAKQMKMTTNEYFKYLIHLAENNKTNLEENLIERTARLEGLVSTLTQSLNANEVKERTLVMTLERDLKQVMLDNKQLHELILSKFEFINALEKVVSK